MKKNSVSGWVVGVLEMGRARVWDGRLVWQGPVDRLGAWLPGMVRGNDIRRGAVDEDAKQRGGPLQAWPSQRLKIRGQ